MSTNELAAVLDSVIQNQKTGFGVNEIVAIVSAVIALAALIFAGLARRDSSASAEEARVANELNRSIARRQGLLELHAVWLNLAKIDPETPVAVDVWNAEKALQTTASLWNHDFLEKHVIIETCWKDFQELYDSILACDKAIPEDGRKCNELVTSEIQRAYDEMSFYTATKKPAVK